MTRTASDPGLIKAQRPGKGTSAGTGAAMRIVTAIAITTTGAFAGGGLLTQTVIVPSWREMAPAAFLDHFAEYGPRTGMTLFPIEAVSTVLLGVVLYSAIRGRRGGRLAWGIAFACMVGTVLLLPIHFLAANDALLSRSVPVELVGAELASWYAWNWLRTGLAIVAVVFSCLAAGYRSTERAALSDHGSRPAT